MRHALIMLSVLRRASTLLPPAAMRSTTARFATDASERTVDGYKYLVTGGKAGKGPAVGVA